MNIRTIKLRREALVAEIAELDELLRLYDKYNGSVARAEVPPGRKRRPMSAQGRKNISEGRKRLFAKRRAERRNPWPATGTANPEGEPK